jgi:hypothetical protein
MYVVHTLQMRFTFGLSYAIWRRFGDNSLTRCAMVWINLSSRARDAPTSSLSSIPAEDHIHLRLIRGRTALRRALLKEIQNIEIYQNRDAHLGVLSSGLSSFR